jgi:hypothetical protein
MRAKLIGCVPILTSVRNQRRVIANTIRLLRPLGPNLRAPIASSAWKAEAAQSCFAEARFSASLFRQRAA